MALLVLSAGSHIYPVLMTFLTPGHLIFNVIAFKKGTVKKKLGNDESNICIHVQYICKQV